MTNEARQHVFVGRAAELRTLLDAFAAAAQKRGGIVLIGGEAGAGKSRLAEELAVRAVEGGARVLSGRAGETGAVPPYWPWVQAIRSYLASLAPDDRAATLPGGAASLAQLLPELRDLLPVAAPEPLLDEEGARLRIFEAVFAILRAAADQQPIVVILDDLHDADPSSLFLLRSVAPQLADSGVLVVGTYRDEELRAGTAGRAVIREIQRLPHATEILLRGLEQTDVVTYISRSTGQTVAPELVRRFMEETEGNALFVTELIRHVDRQGWLLDDRQAGSARLTLPETVREVIHERVAGLSIGCRELLEVAAVVGREFDLSLLEAAAAQAGDEALELLDEALAARVLIETETALRYRFSHGLIRDVVYDGMTSRSRLGRHRKVAQVLETMAGGLVEERAGEIAHHLQAAGGLVEPSRVVRFATFGAEHAISRLAYEEAARLYATGLAALERAPDEHRRVDLLLGLGDALARSGEDPAAKEQFFRAATLARRLGRTEQLARAALGYGGRFVWEASRGDPHLMTLLTDALAAIDGQRTALHARLLARLAAGPMRDGGDLSSRERLSAEAVEIARDLDDLPTLAYVLDGRYAAIWGPDALEERLATAHQLIDISRRVGDRERELQGNHYLCLALLEAADLGGAEAAAAEQRRLARELRQPAQLLYAMTVDTTLAVLQGRYAQAEVLIPAAMAVGQRALQSMSDIYSLFERYLIARDRGTAGELLDELLDVAARFPTYVVVAALIADAYLDAGRPADARAALLRLADGGFAGIPRNDEWVFALAILGDVAAELEESLVAEPLYALLLPFQDRAAVSAPDGCTGAVARVLGRLAALMGRDDEAERLFEHAIEVNGRLNGRPWLARTRYHLAALLQRRGAHNRAAELLESCARDAGALGMVRLAANARSLLDAHGDRVSPEVLRTFLFTDIVRSTELVSAIGDEAWDDVVRWHDTALRELFAAHAGEEIDHAGDGFFVAFSSPRQAAACAIAIQRCLADHRRTAGFAAHVRVGIHADRAIARGGGYKGAGVHQAARIGAAAAGDEILVSQSTLAALGAGFGVTDERSVALKGFAQPVAVVAITWRSSVGVDPDVPVS